MSAAAERVCRMTESGLDDCIDFCFSQREANKKFAPLCEKALKNEKKVLIALLSFNFADSNVVKSRL